MQGKLIWMFWLICAVFYSGQISLATASNLPANQGRDSQKEHNAAQVQPKVLYHQAWEMIRDNFYDPTLNGQSWSSWEHRFDRRLKTPEDAHKAIETMIASLADRYTRFLDSKAFADEKMQIVARLYGVGVQLGMDKNARVIVVSVLEGTPAEKAGLMPMDEISKIDGQKIEGLSIEEVSQKIRGPIDTSVTIGIVRNQQEKEFQLTRAEIPLKAVRTVCMLNKDVGYIRLSTFMSRDAGEEMREALTKLSPARGIVLDLRDNPGGLLDNAIDISNIFLNGGVIVSTVDRQSKKSHAMSTGRPISRQPLVILINPRSASASEITSGALHDNGRAELVGQKSLGKALVQAIRRLDDNSGINITIARYVTPNGIDINKVGIVPDFVVELSDDDYRKAKGPWWLDPGGPTVVRTPEDMKDIQLARAVQILENKLKNSPPMPYEIKLQYPGFGFDARL